ncbi:MAG: pyruvate kinase [Lachnospiraceae bacterium]|nr:pyruvate kinase [Lachnospiraceae bacterium]
MRKTKIICTIGPASESEEMLEKLMLAGMNVARFNYSHGTHEEHKMKFERAMKVSEKLGLPIATLMDTKGPEIRLKDFKAGKVELKAGQKFILTTEDILGDETKVSITYKELKKDVKVGNTLLIDDGLIEMVVEKITEKDIICKVLNDGPVSNHKGVNAPGAVLSMPYISETDRDDIIFATEVGYDFIATSFTRCKEDILQVKEILDDRDSKMKIIAKIENMQGIENLQEILEVADGVMVARGDMGVEIPMEDVPVLQKRIIKLAEFMGKPVVTATQMLESMIKNPRPTRAETTDIANAVYDGTTAIMLSGESAAGKYPVEAVKTMAKIAERAEADTDYAARLKRREIVRPDITTAISHAACDMAMSMPAAAVVAVTMSGFTAGMISRYKPGCLIIAGSTNKRVCRQMNLLWGVTPIFMEGHEKTAEELFDAAIKTSLEGGYLKKGDTVVLTAGVPLGQPGTTNMIRVLEV